LANPAESIESGRTTCQGEGCWLEFYLGVGTRSEKLRRLIVSQINIFPRTPS